jgi:hypothetical protein
MIDRDACLHKNNIKELLLVPFDDKTVYEKTTAN